jgi:hypothetical protein
MIDWDLEAPGLHRYFEEGVRAHGAVRRSEPINWAPGLIDFLTLADASYPAHSRMASGTDDLQTESAYAEIRAGLFERFAEFVIPTSFEKLSILRAGQFDSEYSERIRKFDWEGFHRRDPGFFRAFRQYLGQIYDYVLIDSRTGLTDTSGICVQQLPEKLVLVFAPNRQNLDGVVDIARRSGRFRSASLDPRPLLIFPLASRIDGTNEYLRSAWRNGGTIGKVDIPGYQKIFEDLFVELYELEDCDLQDYFDATQVKHDSDYAYGERIAARRGTSERLSLGYTFADFTRRLVTLSVPWESLPEEIEIRESKRREERSVQITESILLRARILSVLLAALIIAFLSYTVYNKVFLERQRAILAATRTAADPLLQTMLLTELADFPPPPGGASLARKVAINPIPQAVLSGHKGPVLDVAFSPDGLKLATASWDRTARIWNTDGSGTSAVLLGHKEPVVSVHWAASRRKYQDNLITASQDGLALTWRDKKAISAFRNALDRPLLSALFSVDKIVAIDPGGIASAGFSDQLLLPVGEFDRYRVAGFGFDPQRQLIALLTTSGSIAVYDTDTLERDSLGNPPSPVDVMALSPNRSFFMTSSVLGMVLWRKLPDMTNEFREKRWTAKEIVKIPVPDDGTVQAIAFSPQGTDFAVGTSVGTVSVFSFEALTFGHPRQKLFLVGHSAAVRAVAFSPDGRKLATASDDATVRVWNLERQQPSEELGWSGLLSYLRQQSTACLTIEKRVDLLDESLSEARENYAACEERNGRKNSSD